MDDVYQSSLKKCLQNLTKWDEFIKANLNGPQQDEQMSKFKSTVEKLSSIDNEYHTSQNVIASLEENMDSLLNVDDLNEMFNDKMDNEPKESVQSNTIYKKFFSDDIEEVDPKSNKKKRERSYVNIDDSIFMCSSAFAIPIDPISKRPIQNPLRNKNCHHVYEQGAIYDYIRQSKNKARCPYVGCLVNKLNAADLEVDVDLQNRIHHAEQQENSDVDSD